MKTNRKRFFVEGLDMKNNEVIYMVIYKDDMKQKHMTFVKGFSSVKFLEDRFGEVYFEKTDPSFLVSE